MWISINLSQGTVFQNNEVLVCEYEGSKFWGRNLLNALSLEKQGEKLPEDPVPNEPETPWSDRPPTPRPEIPNPGAPRPEVPNPRLPKPNIPIVDNNDEDTPLHV